jgi:hypothetical protein
MVRVYLEDFILIKLLKRLLYEELLFCTLKMEVLKSCLDREINENILQTKLIANLNFKVTILFIFNFILTISMIYLYFLKSS